MNPCLPLPFRREDYEKEIASIKQSKKIFFSNNLTIEAQET